MGSNKRFRKEDEGWIGWGRKKEEGRGGEEKERGRRYEFKIY